MPQSKKQLILQSFEKMDINMLHILLDDDRTYQDATKEVFLSKLEVIFSKLKADGDSFLQLYKGICKSETCNKKGCKGFSFIGNKTNNYIDLIFTESEDDFKDIYYCGEFQTDKLSVEKAYDVPIVIKTDETKAFVPSISFLLKSQKCRIAYDEIMDLKEQIFGSEVYVPWVQKYQALFDSIELFESIFYVELDKFSSLFRSLKDLEEFLSFQYSARSAVEWFENMDLNDEGSLLKWLVVNEELGSKFIMFLYQEIDFEYPESTEYFQINGLKFRTDDFAFIAKFKFYFDENYWTMHDKYSVFTEAEGIEYRREYPELADDTIKLSYSLRKRGMIPY